MSKYQKAVAAFASIGSARTNEGAFMYDHSDDYAVEFFSKAGSMFSGRKAFYGNEQSALELFKPVWFVNKELAMKLLFWLRDVRGGAGNRSSAREIMHWIAKTDPAWVRANMIFFPIHGRWDDLRAFYGTQVEDMAAAGWAAAIKNKDVLAAKWADRSDRPVRLALDMKIGAFRRMLASIRKENIVEHKMCSQSWSEIDYKTVPSVAMSRYSRAFGKNDPARFSLFKEKVERGEEAVHADVLFPHDCVRTVRYGDAQMGDAQFNALPNFLQSDDAKSEIIMVIADTSGSMSQPIAANSSSQCVDVSIGMALYCSSRMPEESPLYKRFIAFCSEGSFKDWRSMSFRQAVNNRSIFNGAIGSTRIDKALNLILKIAIEKDIPQRLMPTTLLIVSDMQFSEGSQTKGSQVEACLKAWDEKGYLRPKVIYWNCSAYAGNQVKALDKNVGLISGYSPSVLKSVFAGTDISPVSIMMKALEKYECVNPELE